MSYWTTKYCSKVKSCSISMIELLYIEIHTHTHTHIYIYIYIYIYIVLSVILGFMQSTIFEQVFNIDLAFGNALCLILYIYIYISLLKGNCKEIKFSVSWNKISTIREKSVKSFNRCFSLPLTDQHHWQDLRLSSIDKCDLMNKDKIWCIYFGLIPKLAWPL